MMPLEDYFNKIAKINKVDKLSIQLFLRNGSSYKRRGLYFVPDIVAVAPIATKNIQTATEKSMDATKNILTNSKDNG